MAVKCGFESRLVLVMISRNTGTHYITEILKAVKPNKNKTHYKVG